MACFVDRILTLDNPIRFSGVEIINASGEDITCKCRFSWADNGVCWSPWVCYDEYLAIAKNLESDFYLRVLVGDVLGRIIVTGQEMKYSISMKPLDFKADICSSPNLFRPYNNLDCALQLQQQLSDTVCCLFGIDALYFKVDPNINTADYTFKEYLLHDVVDCKYLKLMIQDGELPSSNDTLKDFDFDWSVDWETEISKNSFAAAFGDNSIPTERDFVWIPMMNRLWEVNSAYDERKEGLMWRSTTWKLGLIKYKGSSNVDRGDFTDIIDNFTNDLIQKNLTCHEKIEQERETGYDQVKAPNFTATNLTDIFLADAIRAGYTKDLIDIKDNIICHHNTICCRNRYEGKSNQSLITYQKELCGSSGMISFIMELPKITDCDRQILQAGNISFRLSSDKDQYYLGVDKLIASMYPLSTYLVVYRWSKENFTQELSIFKHIYRDDIPHYVVKPEHWWFDIENPIYQKTIAYNNDIEGKGPVWLSPYPLKIDSFKVYNDYISDYLKEAIKYTTTNSTCLINDVVRPISNGRGFQTR